jgi:hypothetical protein
MLSKTVPIRLVKGDAHLLTVNHFVTPSQRGIHRLQETTETALNTAKEAASLPTLLVGLDINNPNSKMIAGPFVVQKTATPSEAAVSEVVGKASAS